MIDSLPQTAFATWAAWAHVTPVRIGRVRDGFVRVRLPPLQIAPDGSGAYPALRVVDASGTEIPYALDPHVPVSDERSVDLIDTGFVPGRGSQAVIDLGTGGGLVDTVTIDVDTDRVPTYFQRIAIDASDDRLTWRDVRDGALIYRVGEDGGRGNQTVGFPQTRSRWLRVRVLDGHAPFPLTGATVARSPQQTPLLPLGVTPRARLDAAAHEQSWTFGANVPIRPAAVTFSATQGTFSRPVRIASSDDGTTWTAVGDETLARFADGSSNLSFAFPETTARYVRVTIENGNDVPLANVRPTLFARPREAVFAATRGERYWLLSNDDAAQPPTYDLDDRLAHERWSADLADAGETEPNPSYRVAAVPFEQRYPWLLTAAIVIVAVLLGGLALRTIRNAGEPET